MNTKKGLLKNLQYLIFLLLIFESCSSDNDVNETTLEEENPIPLQEFYFEGKLGGQEFSMRSEIYESGIEAPIDDYTFDYGGFGIKRAPGTIDGEEVELCYGSYAFGLFPYVSPVENNIISAKLFIRNIRLGECSIENERLGLEDAFKKIGILHLLSRLVIKVLIK